MGDPLKKVQPGQELAIPAEAYNAFVDAAMACRINRSLGLTGPNPPGRQAGLIKVKNNTAGVLQRFAPVGLHSLAITPSGSLENFQNTPVINVVAPGSTTYLGKFAVLQEPLAASYLGDAIVSGVTVSQITVNHASHDRADVDPSGGASLVSAYYGAAEILVVESGTGSKWAVLRLGSFVAPLLKAKAGAQIAVGGSGSVTIYRNGSATESVTAHLNWLDGNQAVVANSELLIQYFRDEAKWVIVGAECTT